MLDLTAAAEFNGRKFDGVDLFLFAPHVDIDSTDEQKKHAVASIGPVKLLTERLDESDTREEAIDQLLPWLIGYEEGRSA